MVQYSLYLLHSVCLSLWPAENKLTVLQNFDEDSPDPQAHLVDSPLQTARFAGAISYSEDTANGAGKRPVAAPEARKAIANEWITPDYAGMGI